MALETTGAGATSNVVDYDEETLINPHLPLKPTTLCKPAKSYCNFNNIEDSNRIDCLNVNKTETNNQHESSNNLKEEIRCIARADKKRPGTRYDTNKKKRKIDTGHYSDDIRSPSQEKDVVDLTVSDEDDGGYNENEVANNKFLNNKEDSNPCDGHDNLHLTMKERKYGEQKYVLLRFNNIGSCRPPIRVEKQINETK